MHDAFATFARGMSDLLLKLATDLETSSAEPVGLSGDAIQAPVPEVTGHRQQAILALPGLATEQGMKTSQVAQAIQYEVPNTHMTLQALERARHIEMVAGSKPQRWRLHSRYRVTARSYMSIAENVRPGEWTTYGDISIALRGDTKAARAIGQVAARIPEFPNPHRVLREPGMISPHWTDHEGRGADHCRKMLESEGVRFVNDLADPAARVTWDVLAERSSGKDAA